MFAKIIDQAPDCAMAYWGVAMSNFHQLWATPTPAELKKGMQAIQIARAIRNKTKREKDYIEAIGQFFENADQFDHRSRVLNFEKAMESIYKTYPDDKEAAVFYALALNTAADPADKTYANQRKAFELLNPIFQKEPLHPGIAHYIIHNCDYPYRLQGNMRPSLLLLHMRNICRLISLLGLGIGTNVSSQISQRLLPPNVMQTGRN